MKLIVGLGNPDKEYLNTFHNLGFMSVEKCADILGVSFSKQKGKSVISECKIKGEKVILAKPLTYMNLSGQAVKELMTFYKIDVKDLLVIYDDYDLPKGNIRIRENGSAGTHNGMRNIIKELGRSDFARVRVGFRPTEPMPIPLIDLVLSGIRAEDKPIFDKAVQVAGSAGADFANGVTIQNVMQRYNGSTQN